MPVRLGDLAERFGCELIGDGDILIETVASLGNAGPGSLSFLSASTFKKQLPSTKAAAVILRADDAADCPAASLISDNPYAAYARMAAAIHPVPVFEPGIHPSAVIAADATIAESAHIAANAVVESGAVLGNRTVVGPGAVVGPGCRVGDDCHLHANVTFVRAVVTGDRCIFHSGCVIGADGFGNAMTPEGWVKVPQLGGVTIGDDVEIGASTTVDCGAIDDTVIENGVRVDNQIQIGHNVRIGEHTALAAGCAVAGSAVIGKRCMLAGMSGVNGHISICDDVVIHGKGMVTKSITEPGVYAGAFPVEPAGTWSRRVAGLRRIGKLSERIKRLENKDS